MVVTDLDSFSIFRQNKVKQRFIEQKTLTEMFKAAEDKVETSPQKAAPELLLKKLPKIFFGTHTHSQIKQIIQELKRTGIFNPQA
jgi:hypothetical protein